MYSLYFVLTISRKSLQVRLSTDFDLSFDPTGHMQTSSAGLQLLILPISM
jgi:hypothetical protein